MTEQPSKEQLRNLREELQRPGSELKRVVVDEVFRRAFPGPGDMVRTRWRQYRWGGKVGMILGLVWIIGMVVMFFALIAGFAWKYL